MADEGSVAVAEAPVVDAAPVEDVSADTGIEEVNKQPDADKLDGRRQPDALRKRIASLREQAASVADPVEKQRLLDDAKELNNRVGKVAAYEQHFPTVREAREVKALVESFGGRDGLATAQTTLQKVKEIDQWMNTGDKRAADAMWKDSPEGMAKLAPAIFSELEKVNPQEYAKAVIPHAVKFFDGIGFPEAFDDMVESFKAGDAAKGEALAAKLANWYSQQRQGAQPTEKKADPEVERLQRELDERKSGDTKQAVDRAYNDVITHAGPVLDKYLKPIVAKLGLSAEQYSALREDAWKHLQDVRNADQTYKTVASAKYAQGLDAATTYIKGETESRAKESAEARAKFWYGHQLKNGAVAAQPNPTAAPITPGITRGKEPTPAEIDYSSKGIAVARRAGFKDLSDMILAGKAPLKSGGIRQWR